MEYLHFEKEFVYSLKISKHELCSHFVNGIYWMKITVKLVMDQLLF